MEIVLFNKILQMTGMNFTYLTNVMTALNPLLTRVLPVVGASLILGRLLAIIKK